MIDLVKFRKLYPMFDEYDDELIRLIEEQADAFISCGCNEQMKMLIVAHMLQIRKNTQSGSGTGVVASATIDKVSVSFSTPTSSSEQGAWLNLTPFGQQFLYLSKRCSVPMFVGGRPELAAFRSVGGRFRNRGRSR